jgi:hypothetical protein
MRAKLKMGSGPYARRFSVCCPPTGGSDPILADKGEYPVHGAESPDYSRDPFGNTIGEEIGRRCGAKMAVRAKALLAMPV